MAGLLSDARQTPTIAEFGEAALVCAVRVIADSAARANTSPIRIFMVNSFACDQPCCLAIAVVASVPPKPMVSIADEGTSTIAPFSRIAS